MDKASLADGPMLFVCAETDSMFTLELREAWEKNLVERGLPATFLVYPGVEHGFAARLDGSENGIKQRLRALSDSVSFFRSHDQAGQLVS